MKKRDRGTTKKECQTCSKEFVSFLSDNRKFCGRKCFEKRRKPSICNGCGIEFYIAGEPNMKYHNQECYHKNGNKGTFKNGHTFNYNKTHSKETKDKISLKHRINRSILIQGTIQFPNFNPIACDVIEKYGKQNGYNFQHALNGGEFYIKELGYWVDGYDKEKNVIIEYQEKHHLTPKYIEKDKKRKEEIIKTLKSKFIYVYFDGKIEIWE
jgi:hypothetical protein